MRGKRASYVGGTSIKRGYHTQNHEQENKNKELERMTNEFLISNGFNLDGSIRKTRK